MSMYSIKSVALTLLLTSLPRVISQGTVIPAVCHTGVMMVALPGTGIANGTYGVSQSLATSTVNAIPDSGMMSWDYDRFFPTGETQYFVPEIENATPQLLLAVQTYMDLCPNTPIVLHGYSEGAVVVMNLLCGASSPGFAPTNPLSSSYSNQSKLNSPLSFFVVC